MKKLILSIALCCAATNFFAQNADPAQLVNDGKAALEAKNYQEAYTKFSTYLTQTNNQDSVIAYNCGVCADKIKKPAELETHKDYIDIQIPLSGTEIMGYTAAQDCLPVDAPYNAEKDITFFEGLAEDYIAVKPGMFAIFFPQDGHAPGITPDGVKKIIVKVKA